MDAEELKVERTPYGTFLVTTTSGDVYRLNDRDGALDVATDHGAVAVMPRAANAVELHGRRKRGDTW